MAKNRFLVENAWKFVEKLSFNIFSDENLWGLMDNELVVDFMINFS